MRSIPVGTEGSYTARVEPGDLASSFKDATLPPVLSTPVMIKYMENAALRAIKPFLDDIETAVGTAVDIRHLAATPVGRWVRAEARVTEVHGRRVVFAVRAADDVREIGVGTHERVVIDGVRFAEELTAQ